MKTVLILDRSPCVRFYHKLLLSRAGYATVVAADRDEAAAVLRNQAVDLLMLEPATQEPGVGALLQETGVVNGVPLLVVSTEAQRLGGALPAKTPGELLQKPVLPDALLSAVRRLIG